VLTSVAVTSSSRGQVPDRWYQGPFRLKDLFSERTVLPVPALPLALLIGDHRGVLGKRNRSVPQVDVVGPVEDGEGRAGKAHKVPPGG
jgi:hypothetical protein